MAIIYGNCGANIRAGNRLGLDGNKEQDRYASLNSINLYKKFRHDNGIVRIVEEDPIKKFRGTIIGKNASGKYYIINKRTFGRTAI